MSAVWCSWVGHEGQIGSSRDGSRPKLSQGLSRTKTTTFKFGKDGDEKNVTTRGRGPNEDEMWTERVREKWPFLGALIQRNDFRAWDTRWSANSLSRLTHDQQWSARNWVSSDSGFAFEILYFYSFPRFPLFSLSQFCFILQFTKMWNIQSDKKYFFPWTRAVRF